MTLTAKVVYVATQKRSGKEGKIYCNASVLADDNVTYQFPIKEEVADSLSQFQKYEFEFEYYLYKGEPQFRLSRTVPADAPTVARKGA